MSILKVCIWKENCYRNVQV